MNYLVRHQVWQKLDLNLFVVVYAHEDSNEHAQTIMSNGVIISPHDFKQSVLGITEYRQFRIINFHQLPMA